MGLAGHGLWLWEARDMVHFKLAVSLALWA